LCAMSWLYSSLLHMTGGATFAVTAGVDWLDPTRFVHQV
jgi:hypothetical protein